jgi:aspartyl-tRNA(Asn)/glutamyl-tRNA(Gln) amidotransferase subunit B
VANKEAIRHILRIGTAVDGELADKTEFDRKSYFYPDIPKGYQISQYEKPFVRRGTLAGVVLTRVHLEEDTARSNHEGGKSLVDFNRAGIPLMELVTEPVIHDAETAGRFARELQLLLRTLGAGEANLEKGEMRIEANISVSKEEGVFGTKVEVKNINSFRAVERAIAYEIKRQTALLEKGEKVVQSTRGWDESKQETFHQRLKEGSADYRYFPEPDLPKLAISEIPEFSHENLKASLPELPWERRERYASLGLKSADIEIIIASVERTNFFDAVLGELGTQGGSAVLKTYGILAANFFVSDLAGEPGKLSPSAFVALLKMFAGKELSSRGAKDILAILVAEGGTPEVIAKEKGLLQIHDPAVLSKAVDTVLAQEEKAVAEYKAGKQASLQYLLGKAMKESRGAGNPEELKKILIEKLG